MKRNRFQLNANTVTDSSVASSSSSGDDTRFDSSGHGNMSGPFEPPVLAKPQDPIIGGTFQSILGPQEKPPSLDDIRQEIEHDKIVIQAKDCKRYLMDCNFQGQSYRIDFQDLQQVLQIIHDMKDSSLVAASSSLSKLIGLTHDFFKKDHSKEAEMIIETEMEGQIKTIIQENDLPDESEEDLKEARLNKATDKVPKETDEVELDEIFNSRHESTMSMEDLESMTYNPTKKQAPAIRFEAGTTRNIEGIDTMHTLEKDVANMVNVLWFHKTESTYNYYEYGVRVYFAFWKKNIASMPLDSSWRRYQPTAFPVKKFTYLKFLMVSRASGFAHKTVKGCFVYAFSMFMKRNPKFGTSPLDDYYDAVKECIDALIRLYGISVYKVPPLLSGDWYKITCGLDLKTMNGATDAAVLHLLRATGMRPDSASFIELQDIHFMKKSYTIDNEAPWFVIHCQMYVKKHKNANKSITPIVIYGKKNHSLCSSFIILYYLWFCRPKVFTHYNSDWKEFIKAEQFQFHQDHLMEPLFFLKQSNKRADADQLSEWIRNASQSIVGMSYCSRSCRCGLVISNMLIDLVEHQQVRMETKQALCYQLVHAKISSLAPYERTACLMLQQLPENCLDLVYHKQMMFRFMISDAMEGQLGSSSDTLETTFRNLQSSTNSIKRKDIRSNPNLVSEFQLLYHSAVTPGQTEKQRGKQNEKQKRQSKQLPQNGTRGSSQGDVSSLQIVPCHQLPSTRIMYALRKYIGAAVPILGYVQKDISMNRLVNNTAKGTTDKKSRKCDWLDRIWKRMFKYYRGQVDCFLDQQDIDQYGIDIWKNPKKRLSRFKAILNSWYTKKNMAPLDQLIESLNKELQDYKWFPGIPNPFDNPSDNEAQKFYDRFQLNQEIIQEQYLAGNNGDGWHDIEQIIRKHLKDPSIFEETECDFSDDEDESISLELVNDNSDNDNLVSDKIHNDDQVNNNIMNGGEQNDPSLESDEEAIILVDVMEDSDHDLSEEPTYIINKVLSFNARKNMFLVSWQGYPGEDSFIPLSNFHDETLALEYLDSIKIPRAVVNRPNKKF